MSELTDDQLDGLFRKSAEEFKPPFDSAAWQDMKARLDANDHSVPTSGVSLVNNILRWGLPTVLLLLLFGWFFYKSDKSANPVALSTVKSKPGITKETTDRGGRPLASDRLTDGEIATKKSMRAPEQTVINSRPISGLEQVPPDQSMADSRTNAVKTRGVPDKVRPVKRSKLEESEQEGLVSVTVVENKWVSRSPLDKLPSDKSLSRVVNVKSTTNRRFRRKSLTISNSLDEKFRKYTADHELIDTPNNTYGLKARPISGKQRGTNFLAEIPENGSTGSVNELPASINEPTAVALPYIAELVSRPAKWPKSLPFTSRSVEVHPDTTAKKIASQPATDRGLSIRFAVSPDLSGIGLKNFARPGTNIGLLLEYRLSQHWSVQSGVIQSTKVYKALTSEYTVPAGLWQLPLKLPESVDGRCTIFDIPINIRYDVIVKPRLNGALPTRWFINGGVTSYIMNNENYHYTYPPHTYNQPVDYSASTGGYGFSHINVSMGYEQSISRRLSWQVEPFMKIPLKGVGFFKVNLSSTGAFFSLRYKL